MWIFPGRDLVLLIILTPHEYTIRSDCFVCKFITILHWSIIYNQSKSMVCFGKIAVSHVFFSMLFEVRGLKMCKTSSSPLGTLLSALTCTTIHNVSSAGRLYVSLTSFLVFPFPPDLRHGFAAAIPNTVSTAPVALYIVLPLGELLCQQLQRWLLCRRWFEIMPTVMSHVCLRLTPYVFPM